MDSYFPKAGKLIGGIIMLTILLSSLWLIWIGETNIRYSGDHKGTIPFWYKWIPVIVGILLVRFLPFHHKNYNPLQQFEPRRIIIQTAILFLSGSLFTICLLTTNFEGMALQLWFMIFKIILLLFTPLMLLLFYKKERPKQVKSTGDIRWYQSTPLIVIIIWGYFNFFSIFSTPFVSMKMEPTILISILLVGFLINSVLEEIFYRVWLQTRLELLLGTWPAILLTSLLWASWHIALHGSGHWDIDTATVIVNLGIVGLFLGYLWARYRKVWVIIIVHGLINAHPQQLIEIIFK
ncbi:CPBP family intramembrane metalloprotease domain-containing protein [Bacillus thuringiensis]|uniref:CPBP family intramembrane glutamic endopeptidase n=2 Tax=Bacillus thuringiensis TaxID=1428 RepID=UPI000BECDC6D|nr:CPBP family intramembrane glutamic endopeptidase [Bacillus thuringiensis]MEC2256787.1 CPBP family intramembrane metalloprotease [Bacillus cereus]MED3055401.1 CPBP family intramembrane metalloprotease [Bacillus thuringiensis]PDX93942.1 CPBP family intramembrane metalloprotease domain-containing protein [Bacillus thuringiensis]PEA16077.1 CPBP family intramembrane metalloprotease domain-containing protein [Bacillus thuringiensis]PEB75986.1 CPBP family intramembrane metalloprotease domain-conta